MSKQIDIKKVLSEVKSYVIISIGLLIYSFGWMGILMPSKVIGGGVTGLSQIIFFATSTDGAGGIPIGISYFAINAILVGIAMFIIGPNFGAKTIYAMVFNSFALMLMQAIIPPGLMGLEQDKLLSAILGGGLGGIGIAICFWQGGSTGGTDIIALIVNKYHNMSLGRVIMLCDVVIIGSTYLVFHSITSIVYGYVTLVVLGYTIDMFMQGNRQTCQLIIISKNYDQIVNTIISDARRGVTLLDGSGGYTGTPQKIIMVFCRRNEVTEIYRLVRNLDTSAFISNASVSNVYGNGFDNLKLKSKSN